MEIDIQTKTANHIKQHISEVRSKLLDIIAKLADRARLHDASKLVSPEIDGFAAVHERFIQAEYGTEEYHTCCKLIEPTLKHHYSVNSHHPQHYERGLNGMDLIDLVELFCDWKAASMGTPNGNFMQSIERNQSRFGMSSQLKEIFENTAKRLGWTE